LKVHFTFKISNFNMEFLTNHMFTYIYKVFYHYFNHKHKGMHIE